MADEITAAPAAPAPAGSPTPAPAPAATPPAPAPQAPADTVTIAEPAAPASAEVVEYSPTPDPGLNLALKFVGKLGFGPEHPAMKAAVDGNFDQLKGALTQLGDKAAGWEDMIALAERAYENESTTTKERQAKDQAAIFGIVGGEENWKAIQTWAGQNAEPAEREAVNRALGMGGMAAKAMAAYLGGLYAKASGTVIEGASVLKPGADRNAGPGTALSPKAYAAEVFQLHQKLGYKMESSPEYKQLQIRRQAFRG